MPKFLIVDDEAEICQALEIALSQNGYSVRTCTNGTQAIELFRRERTDLVFCDMKLPGLDGMGVLEGLKSIDPGVTVIMITAYGSVEAATRALRLGAYDFLEKPCTMAQIQKVTQQALEHRKQLHQLTMIQGKPGTSLDLPSKLSQSEQIRFDFLKLAMQELRLPLTLLNEALTLVEDGSYGLWGEPSKQRFLNQCARIQALLSRTFLGCLALFLSHDHHVAPSTGDVRSALEELLKETALRCTEQRLVWEQTLPSEPLIGSTDLEKVVCIVQELLDNAFYYVLAGGTLSFSLIQSEGGFQIHVKNTGHSIPAEEKKWLFTTVRDWKTGQIHSQKVGLVLLRHYVDLLNGKFELKEVRSGGNEIIATFPWISLSNSGVHL